MGFKENLRSELDFQDMIVKELSEKTGINKRTLDNYLSGHNSLPTVDLAVKIANALGVSVEYLVTGKDKNVKEHAYTPSARKLLELFSVLDERDQQTVVQLAESMSARYANAGGKENSPSRVG